MYIGLVDGKPGAYGLHVPDLPGCCAMGATLPALIDNAGAAIHDWIEVTAEQGEPIPPPRDFEALCEDGEVKVSVAERAVFVLGAVDTYRSPMMVAARVMIA